MRPCRQIPVQPSSPPLLLSPAANLWADPRALSQDVSPVLHQREGHQGVHHQEGIPSRCADAVCPPSSFLPG
ncbi:hypothetical protein ZWY2020_021051 [Hordeum vulgare]|nr:hypothetical protein ZWY2020_021051 [Hordeum vulgare]